jgi:PAS domain S-box-containing protein
MAANPDLLIAHHSIQPTNVERKFKPEQLIVSKTDLKGHITYANKIFCDISGYSLEELMGTPHKILRHPDMPRCIFKLLWETIESGNEIFAYVKNMCRNGDYYWVFAHVTPTFDRDGKTIIGYHSNRRMPTPESVRFFSELYDQLLKREASYADRKAGLESSYGQLLKILEREGVTYDEFVFSRTKI